MNTSIYLYFFLQTEPKSVELVEGYGVRLTQRQLDCAIDCAGNSPTKLMWHLLGIFFPPDVFAQSSALGKRGNVALDQDILDACIRKQQ